MTSRRGGWPLIGATALALVAVTCATLGWSRLDAGTGRAAESGRRSAVPAQVEPRVTPVADTRPAGLRIPSIGVATRLVRLGLQADGTVEVPLDPDDAGWYRLGPAPGVSGSAVILGHVDSTTGPAVFYRLRELRAGNRIEVARRDGTVVRFAVRSIETYANADFPAADVYRNDGAPTLTLVTCGGAYNKAKGGYQANVVVTAVAVGTVLERTPGAATSRDYQRRPPTWPPVVRDTY